MADAKRRFENLTACESEALHAVVNRGNDGWRSVMRVEGRCLGRADFLRVEQLAETFALLPPARIVVGGEDLRQSPPADVAHENAPFLRSGQAALAFEPPEQFDG